MNRQNEATCWSTPLTNACFVSIASLVHEGSLTITFRADFEEIVSLVSFCFKQPASYKFGSAILAADQLGFTLKQNRPSPVIWEISLFNLKELGHFAAAMYGQPEINLDRDRYIFVLEDKTVEVCSSERPDVHVIGSQLKLAS